MINEELHSKATLGERAKSASTARREMEQHMAKLRFQRSLPHNVPPSANSAYQPCGKVLIWREKLISNRIGEWVGPFEVNGVDNTSMLV